MEFCKETGKPLKEASNIIASEKIKKPVKKGEGILRESDENKCAKGFPHKCGKCGCEFADVSDLGVFYSDESSVYLFKCKKCGKVERDAYGLSNA